MSISHHLAFDHKNSVNVLPIASSSDISYDEWLLKRVVILRIITSGSLF